MLSKLGEGTKITIVFKNNQACISWASDEENRNNHIDVRYHVCRKACDNGEVVLKYCLTTEIIADTLTNLSSHYKFEIIKCIIPMAASAWEPFCKECRNLRMGDEATLPRRGVE